MQLLVKLQTVDNVVIAVEERVARLSGLVNGILTDNDDGIPIGAISVAETTAPILQLVILWCEHHKNDPECLQNEYLANLDNLRSLPEWDERLLGDLDSATLAGVISAAEQMKIPKLLYLARRMLRMRSTRGNLMGNNNNAPMDLEEEEEDGGGGGEEADGHDRNFPILNSQAIIEIGQMLR